MRRSPTRPWCDLDAVELATLEWIERFNHRCLFAPVGDMTAAEKGEKYYQNEERAKVTRLKPKSLRKSGGSTQTEE